MKLIDLNRKQDVGSSCHLIELGPFRLVIDAGLHPKFFGNQSLPYITAIPQGTVDFIILTHCHLDHLGALPVIKRYQPQAPILTSLASSYLVERLLRDSQKVMIKQQEQTGLPELPLYRRLDIDLTEKALMPMDFHRSRTFEKNGESIEITFFPSGHIVGAAAILIKYKHRKIFFSGDVLFENQVTLSGADFPNETFDTLIIETTRGAVDPDTVKARKSENQRLIQTINNTIIRGGSCVIPVFALGRMQEIIGVLDDAKKQGHLIECPIFCSGLGLDLVDYCETIAKKTNAINFRKKMLTNLGIKSLAERLDPGEDLKHNGIYLLSSGMLVEYTPSYLAVASALEHHKNSICFVGYCDPDTPGGKLLQSPHGSTFSFPALKYSAKVMATIEKFDLSAHAKRNEIMEFIHKCDPRAIVLTHGDPEAREWFEQELAIQMPNKKVLNPIPLQEYLV